MDETSIAPTFSHYKQNLHFCSIRCSSAFDEDSESKKKGKPRKRKFNGEAKVCTNPKSQDFEDAPYEGGHGR